MKRQSAALAILAVTFAASAVASADAYKFAYRMNPGQTWITTSMTQTETTVAGTRGVFRQTTVIEYKVLKGPKQGWVSLEASIKSRSEEYDGKRTDNDPTAVTSQNDTARIQFTGDMHRSGEFRNMKAEVPADIKAMRDQPANRWRAEQAELIADGGKYIVFWLPELPEYGLKPGDEFDVVQKAKTGTGADFTQSQWAVKHSYSLEDVSGGLALFSTSMKMQYTMATGGTKSEVQAQAKGQATFDMKQGMWLDLTSRTHSLTKTAGMNAVVLVIEKRTMERR